MVATLFWSKYKLRMKKCSRVKPTLIIMFAKIERQTHKLYTMIVQVSSRAHSLRMRDQHKLLVDIKDLTRGYDPHQEPLFKDFNFALYKHDFCVIAGRSGVGKSTLAKFLMRQIVPPRKTIYHRHEDMSRYSEKEVQYYRRNIGFVFQDYKLLERKTVYENILYPLQILGVPLEKRRALALHTLELVDLLDHKDDYTQTLSGGQKQKVAIARALVHNPEFIIADEPTGNLDREQSKMIGQHMINLNKAGNTIVFITHDLYLVEFIKKQHPHTTVFTM